MTEEIKSPYRDEQREQREEIRKKTRRLPVLGVLATIAVIFASAFGIAVVAGIGGQADSNSATIKQLEDERTERALAAAEAVARSCVNDNRQADYNDFLLNELVRGHNNSSAKWTPVELTTVEGLRNSIGALRQDCREAPLVANVRRIGHVPGLMTPAATGERQVPIVKPELH